MKPDGIDSRSDFLFLYSAAGRQCAMASRLLACAFTVYPSSLDDECSGIACLRQR